MGDSVNESGARIRNTRITLQERERTFVTTVNFLRKKRASKNVGTSICSLVMLVNRTDVQARVGFPLSPSQIARSRKNTLMFCVCPHTDPTNQTAGLNRNRLVLTRRVARGRCCFSRILLISTALSRPNIKLNCLIR